MLKMMKKDNLFADMFHATNHFENDVAYDKQSE